MTACDRFESEGLARFVAGQPLEPHFESCPDCQAARASYQALALALQQARDAYVPAGDWEAKVWARIQRGEQARRRALWPGFLGATAAVAALGFFFVNSVGGPATLALATYQVESGRGPVVRALGHSDGDVQSAAPGNVLHLVVKVPRGKQGDVRVYRGTDELVFQCATSPACIRSKDSLEARVTLDRPGSYRTILLAADKVLPAASGNLDADYAAARRAGSAEERGPLEVL